MRCPLLLGSEVNAPMGDLNFSRAAVPGRNFEVPSALALKKGTFARQQLHGSGKSTIGSGTSESAV
jgi:hypothetical protein